MTEPAIPAAILAALQLADPSWRPHLEAGLAAMAAQDPAYLPALAADDYLPTGGRLFAAFALPLEAVRYVLVGEGPYPRAGKRDRGLLHGWRGGRAVVGRPACPSRSTAPPRCATS